MDGNLKTLLYPFFVIGHCVSEKMMSPAVEKRWAVIILLFIIHYFNISEHLITYYHICNLEVMIHFVFHLSI